MKRSIPVSFIALALTLSSVFVDQITVAAEPLDEYEARKKVARPKENLTAQELTDIYFSCINELFANPETKRAGAPTLGSLRSQCNEERTNLRFKLSAQAVNEIDQNLVTQFNSELAKQGA